jgi:hypothetical protein
VVSSRPLVPTPGNPVSANYTTPSADRCFSGYYDRTGSERRRRWWRLRNSHQRSRYPRTESDRIRFAYNRRGNVPISNTGQTCSSSLCTVTAATVLCNATTGAITLNLPVANGTFRHITIIKTDSTSNACTPTANGTDTIDGSATLAIPTQYYAATISDDAAGAWGAALRSSGDAWTIRAAAWNTRPCDCS